MYLAHCRTVETVPVGGFTYVALLRCRMEPLAVEGGEKRRPVFADYHRGGRRLHIGLQVNQDRFPRSP